MDAESVSGHLLPQGSVYPFLAGHRRELFPDAMFADLFPSALGRPNVPADVVAVVLGLQALEGLLELIPGGFTAEDFTIHEPAPWPARPGSLDRSPAPETRSSERPAGAARCTRSLDGRTVHLHEHDALQRAHRARAADPDFQADYRRHRPMIERSIAWLSRGHRRGALPWSGQE